MLDRPEEYEKMAAAESGLWWYAALHEQVCSAIASQFSSRDISIVDAACGTGGLLVRLRGMGYADARGFDLSENAVRIASSRGCDAVLRDLADISEGYGPSSVDVIICNDALYHLPEGRREGFVRSCGGILRRKGLLIMNLPALDVFSGTHDVVIGIGHRFSRGEAVRLVSAGPFGIKTGCYWPFFASPAIFAARFFQRVRMRVLCRGRLSSDVELPPKAVNWILKRMAIAENRIFRWKPWGSSFFLVAERI